MRALLIALAAGLVLAAPASASPFEELPFQTLPGGTGCVRPTGAPGELAVWAPRGVRFLTAGASGTIVSLGDSGTCPVSAAQPNGAGVVAAATSAGISIALREPGAAWGAPVKLAVPSRIEVEHLAAAVSEGGDALVMWTEENYERRDMVSRVRVARRPSGGAFGAPQTLASSSGPFFTADLRAGMAADGTAIAAWTYLTVAAHDVRTVADAAIAAPGTSFGAGRRLTAESGNAVALSVAADGHALVAYSDNGRVRIVERTPGSDFSAPQTLGSGSADKLAVALGSGAEALVAWGDELTTRVTYARRDASGFRPPVELTPAGAFDFTYEQLGGEGFIQTGNGPPADDHGSDLRATYASDGRVVLSWGERRDRSGVKWIAAHVATVAADDSYTTQVVSGPLRDAGSIAPIVLPSGAAAVAWSDNGRIDGRLHVAAEGATTVPHAVPQVRIGTPEHAALRLRHPLVVPVTCSAACDLRATIRGLTASASLTRAGTVKLRFLGTHPAAPPHAARVPVVVLSGAPGARDAQTQVIRPRLRRIPDPPLPRILDLTAIRAGSTVTVTWRLSRSGAGVSFVAYSSHTRDGEPGPAQFKRGSSKTSMSLTLRKVPATHTYVNMQWGRGEGRLRRRSVRIR